VDYVVTGEAEHAWPQFVQSFRAGNAPKKTSASGFPEMDSIPVPAWDRVDYGEFLFHQIQSTRGCPFTCRFCSVPDISGQSFRFKPVEKIVEEIRAFPKTGFLRDRMKTLYFVDDNFLSRPQYTEDLLRALIPLHKSGELRGWSAETTLNVTNRPGLLELFAEAGCTTLIIGFESINEATLVAMDKRVNFCVDYQEALARIHNLGMSVVGNFIVGFDTDTLSVFKDILDFVNENRILYPFFSILTPMPGTKLHEDYKSAGRLDHFDWGLYDTRHVVFEPEHMTREQLLDGYCYLYREAYASEGALDRLEEFWALHRLRKSSWAENVFIRGKLRKYRGKVSPRFDWMIDEGVRRLKHGAGNTDISQLLYYLDAAHFVEYQDGFRSANFDANVALFEQWGLSSEEERNLLQRQWQRKSRSNRRSVG